MKRNIAAALVIVFMCGLAGACQAGWLHRTYQGQLEANGHRYVVNVDGTISVQHKWTPSPGSIGVSSGCCSWNPCNSGCASGSSGSVEPTWVTDLIIKGPEDLRNIIDGLQQVQKEIDSVDQGAPSPK